MKTARQAGWSLRSDKFGLVVLYDDYGNYLEVWANIYGEVKSFGDITIFDLPQSVLELVCLWLEVSVPVLI